MNNQTFHQPNQTVMTTVDYDHEFLKETHQEFRNFITNLPNLKPLTQDEKRKNHKLLENISNQREFQDFCENKSVGFYYRVCFWTQGLKIERLFNVKDFKFVFEKHHIECKYMEKEKYKISKTHLNLIKEKYNLVTVSRAMHSCLHVIRCYEYLYDEDFSFLQFIKVDSTKIDQNVTKTPLEKDLENSVSVKNILVNLLDPNSDFSKNSLLVTDTLLEILKPNPDFSKKCQEIADQKLAYSKKGGFQNAVNHLNQTTIYYFNNEMTWFNDKLNIQVTFKANQFKILRELVVALHDLRPAQILPNNWQNNPIYLEDQSTYLVDYLLGTPKSTKVDGVEFYYPPRSYKEWECEEAFKNQNRIETIKKSIETNQKNNPPTLSNNVANTLSKISKISKVNKQSAKINDILMNKTMEWSHEWWFLHDEPDLKEKARKLVIYPQEFKNVTFLVLYLMDLIPPIKKIEHPEFEFYCTNNEARKIIKRGFSNILNNKETPSGKLKNMSAYGWYCKTIF